MRALSLSLSLFFSGEVLGKRSKGFALVLDQVLSSSLHAHPFCMRVLDTCASGNWQSDDPFLFSSPLFSPPLPPVLVSCGPPLRHAHGCIARTPPTRVHEQEMGCEFSSVEGNLTEKVLGHLRFISGTSFLEAGANLGNVSATMRLCGVCVCDVG